jgi:hypothetical protein
MGICTGCHSLHTNTRVTNVSWCIHKGRPFISWQYGDWFSSRCRQKLIYVSSSEDNKISHIQTPSYSTLLKYVQYQSSGRQVTRMNALFMMEPNICEFSVWNLLCVTTFVVPRILRWLEDFWKICAPLSI